MKIMLDENAILPCRAHDTDAGYDLFAREEKIIEPRSSATFDTGVHVELPEGMVGMIKSKSGLNVKHGLVSEGVIDCGYTGSIVVKLYNHSDERYIVKAGDKISQLVIMPFFWESYLEIVEEFAETDRGNDGFGSTGR